MATKKKNTVKEVKAILNDSKLQNYNTNFTISKKRKGGKGGNGGPRTPQAPKWFENFVTQKFDPLVQRMDNLEKTVSTLKDNISTLDNTVSTQFDAHGWTK